MSLAYEEKAAGGLELLGLTTARERLDAAAQTAAAQQWSYSHFLGYLLEAELTERHRRAVALNLQLAKFPYLKRLEQFDFGAQPSIDRRLVEELATARFLAEARNLVLLGPPGVGTMPGTGLCRVG
jgi:DNA replication protein DnaC